MIPALIPLILGQLAQKALPRVIDAAVDALVKAPGVPVEPDHAQATKDALAPVIGKVVGAGRWPLALGGFGTFFAGLSSLCYAVGSGNTDIQVYITALGGIATGVTTLYGLWRVKRAVK